MNILLLVAVVCGALIGALAVYVGGDCGKENARLREAVLELADAHEWGSDGHVKERVIAILEGKR